MNKSEPLVSHGRTSPVRLHDRVVNELTQQVVSGAWPPGYLVPTEAELCAMMKVSRTALREGMRLLVYRGLIIVRQGKGTVVAPRSHWDLLDPLVLNEGLRHNLPGLRNHLKEVSLLLEPVAVGLAAERATVAQRAELDDLGEQLCRHFDDLDLYFELSPRFHLALIGAANNPLLERMLAPLYATFGLWRRERAVPVALHGPDHEDHEAMLAAVHARDRVAGEAVAARHLAKVFERGNTVASEAAAGAVSLAGSR